MKGFKIEKEYYGENNIKRDINILQFVYDKEVIKNNIEARCQIIRGELAYNTILGIGFKSNKDTMDLDISSIIKTTEGVKNILTFSSTLINGKYSAKINIQTIYNDIVEVNI